MLQLISSMEHWIHMEQWLDGEGNLMDEECIVDLDSNGKQAIQKLQDLANASSKGPGKKCKHGPKHQVPNAINASEKKNKKDTCSIAKENVTLAQWIAILDWHHEQKKSQQETATYFNIKYPSLQLKQPIISVWLKDEEKWHQQWENSP
ncbi:hypothetical protein F5141DRAFT_1061319 [Pisolithus sp. B1]|nr:hypothetical protein F5141DRAFT_1061319 [Pisolithus sp. B1]